MFTRFFNGKSLLVVVYIIFMVVFEHHVINQYQNSCREILRYICTIYAKFLKGSNSEFSLCSMFEQQGSSWNSLYLKLITNTDVIIFSMYTFSKPFMICFIIYLHKNTKYRCALQLHHWFSCDNLLFAHVTSVLLMILVLINVVKTLFV